MADPKIVSAGISASLGLTAGMVDADVLTATLTEVRVYGNSSTAGAAGNISSSTATWGYDNVSQLLTQVGGTYSVRFTTAPTTTLYRLSITGLVIGNSGPASATTFVCSEGNFGSGVGASLCGNYYFGTNFVNESTTTWGPVASLSRTMGGDDEALGPPQGPATFDGFRQTSIGGTSLVLSNATCTGTCATLPVGAFNQGQRWTFTVVGAQPGPYDDVVAVGMGLPIDIDVAANDYLVALEHTLSVASPPDQGGTATVSGSKIHYVPAPGFSGVETFVYRLSTSPTVYADDTATVYVEVVDPLTNPDADGDGVADRVDNCTQRANYNQCDSDGDGYGNRCDGDLDGNNATNAQDTVSFRYRLGTTSPVPESWFYMAADINCNGTVNAQDTSLFRQLLGSPPGPSGRRP